MRDRDGRWLSFVTAQTRHKPQADDPHRQQAGDALPGQSASPLSESAGSPAQRGGVSSALKLVAAIAAQGAVFAAGSSAHAQVNLDEVVVARPRDAAPSGRPSTAAPGDLTIDPNALQATTIVTGDEIARSTATSLGDLLSNKPGINSSSFAPGSASRPIIRGLDGYRVKIQENGVGVGDASDFSEDHRVPIDPVAVDRIEVIRGPAVLRYDSQAIGGVVNTSNNRIPETLPTAFGARFKGAGSSGDQGLDGSAVLDGAQGNVAIHADGYVRKSSEYRIPGGTQTNTFQTSQGQSIGASVIFDNGFAGMALSRTNSLYGIPGVQDTKDRTRIDLEQIKLTGKSEVRVQSGAVDTIRAWFGVTDYRHFELGLDAGGVDGTRNIIINREQEGRVEIAHAAFDTAMGVLTGNWGAQLSHRELGTAGDTGGLLAPTDTKTAAAYIFEDLKLTDAVKLQAAGRIENANVKGMAATFPSTLLPPPATFTETTAGRVFTPKSGSVGILADIPGGLVATLTGQYVERAPAAPELYSRGSDEASGTFVIGNRDLKIESAKTVEVGLKRAAGSVRFEANAYYTQFTDFIFKRITGNRCTDVFATCGAVGDLTQIAYGQRGATFTGAEVAAQFDVAPLGGGMLVLETQYDIVQAKFADGSNVPRISPQRVGGGLLWRDGEWLARANLLHAFAQRNVAQNETPTDGYDNLRAEIVRTVNLQPADYGARDLTMGVSADNLLDVDMRNHVSFKKNEVLLPGRTVRAFASLRF